MAGGYRLIDTSGKRGIRSFSQTVTKVGKHQILISWLDDEGDDEEDIDNATLMATMMMASPVMAQDFQDQCLQLPDDRFLESDRRQHQSVWKSAGKRRKF